MPLVNEVVSQAAQLITTKRRSEFTPESQERQPQRPGLSQCYHTQTHIVSYLSGPLLLAQHGHLQQERMFLKKSYIIAKSTPKL